MESYLDIINIIRSASEAYNVSLSNIYNKSKSIDMSLNELLEDLPELDSTEIYEDRMIKNIKRNSVIIIPNTKPEDIIIINNINLKSQAKLLGNLITKIKESKSDKTDLYLEVDDLSFALLQKSFILRKEI